MISALGWKGQEKVILGYRVSLRTATAACDPDSKQRQKANKHHPSRHTKQSKQSKRKRENKSEERDVEEREGWNGGWLKSSHRRSPS